MFLYLPFLVLELIQLLSDTLNLNKSNITIVSGQSNRMKQVCCIYGIEKSHFKFKIKF